MDASEGGPRPRATSWMDLFPHQVLELVVVGGKREGNIRMGKGDQCIKIIGIHIPIHALTAEEANTCSCTKSRHAKLSSEQLGRPMCVFNFACIHQALFGYFRRMYGPVM